MVMASQFQAPARLYHGGHFSADVLVLGWYLCWLRGEQADSDRMVPGTVNGAGSFLLGMAVYFGYSAGSSGMGKLLFSYL